VAALEAAQCLPRCYVSINASPVLILAKPLSHIVAGSGLPPDCVVVEVTEQTRVDDYAALIAALAPLRRAGMRMRWTTPARATHHSATSCSCARTSSRSTGR
jgi:EAL domain-containing protein (putative c-di-GMP-specific phosphodiesterase class I)